MNTILRHDLSRWCRGALVPDMTGGRQLGTDACSEIPHAGLRFASWNTTAHERKQGIIVLIACATLLNEFFLMEIGHLVRTFAEGNVT